MYKLLILLGLVYFINGQVVVLERCPDIHAMKDLDVASYLGKWFEAQKYFAIFEFNAKCISATYGDLKNGSISVFNEQINKKTGEPNSITGYATPINGTDEAKLDVVFPTAKNPFHGGKDGNYWVLETDYENYSVVWTCGNFGLVSVRYSWILTRDAQPSDDILQKAYNVYDRNNITRSHLTVTDQSDCS